MTKFKSLVVLSILLQVVLCFGEDKPLPKPDIIEETENYTVMCIRGNEFVQDYQGTLTQIMQKETYKLTGVEPIPVSLPKSCTPKGTFQFIKKKDN